MTAPSRSTSESRPVVLVPACNRTLGHHPFHIAGKKYVDSVRLAGCVPLVVPNADEADFDVLLALADGVLLTGSPSNVHPSHFDEGVHDPSLPLDVSRDAWTLPFIRRVLERGVPMLAICRGLQETNVALGGSLHQAVHEVPPHADHRARPDTPVEVQYGPAHEVTVTPGGMLDRVLEQKSFTVNSLHGQAVARVAPGLRIEARAPDGLVEAVSIESLPFGVCVQWHPEWQSADNPVSVQLFKAFGLACKSYRDKRSGLVT